MSERNPTLQVTGLPVKTPQTHDQQIGNVYTSIKTRSVAVAKKADCTAAAEPNRLKCLVWNSHAEISAVRYFADNSVMMMNSVCYGWTKQPTALCGLTIHPTAKVSEEVNRKCPVRNKTVQLWTLYTDLQCHNAQRYRQTDRRQYHAQRRSCCMSYDPQKRIKMQYGVSLRHLFIINDSVLCLVMKTTKVRQNLEGTFANFHLCLLDSVAVVYRKRHQLGSSWMIWRKSIYAAEMTKEVLCHFSSVDSFPSEDFINRDLQPVFEKTCATTQKTWKVMFFGFWKKR